MLSDENLNVVPEDEAGDIDLYKKTYKKIKFQLFIRKSWSQHNQKDRYEKENSTA